MIVFNFQSLDGYTATNRIVVNEKEIQKPLCVRESVCVQRLCTCLSDPEPTAISSSARRFSNSAIYRDRTRKNTGSDKHILQDTHKCPCTHLSAFCPIHQILWHFSPEMNTQNVSLKHLLAHSTKYFVFTLADSLNFSCSGLLCSSYSTTPSGPLADAVGLPSPVVLPRLPLATSSWVSRRLWEEKKRRHKRILCSIWLSAPCPAASPYSLYQSLQALL